MMPFSPAGFQWQAFCPAYGLAEATLLVSASRCTEEPRLLEVKAQALENNQIVEADEDGAGTRWVVGCGRVFDTTNLAIVRPDTRTRCAADEVGEIWVADPAVAAGYWERPAETEETFGAHTVDTAEGPFLRTGDLGFLKHDELFIAGRLKDLVIIRGTNHHPQDIEWTVQASHPALRPENGAASRCSWTARRSWSSPRKSSANTSRSLKRGEVIRAIRQNVAEEHELDVFAIVLLSRGSIPKTASAKMQRQACRTFYLHGGPQVLGSWVAATGKLDLLPSWLDEFRNGL